jgi:hypothetical protein
LPTAFDAAPRDVDELRCAARRLLATNPEYRRLMREAGAGDGAAPSADCSAVP